MSKYKRTKWTDDRIAVLENLWEKGFTASQIAKTLGDVTRNSVIGKIHRLGLTSHSANNTITMPTYNFMKKSSISIDGQ